jgi:HKD family nuclease
VQARIVDDSSLTMARVLSAAIQGSQDIRMAVAFASRSGFSLIWEPLESALSAGAYVEFIVGLDRRVTEPAVLQSLYELNRANTNVSFYCYSKEKESGIYHPKLYILRANDEVTTVVGSSNLTEGGLRKNIEINVAISGNIRDEVIADSYTAYDHLKFDNKHFEPDEEYLATYGEARKREQARTSQDVVLKELIKHLEEKAKSLRRPKPTRRDVVGWLELIYNALPDGEFTNSQIYLNEQTFQEKYPDNDNIRAKIRQQLQVLRDRGAIEQITPGRWRKL